VFFLVGVTFSKTRSQTHHPPTPAHGVSGRRAAGMGASTSRGSTLDAALSGSICSCTHERECRDVRVPRSGEDGPAPLPGLTQKHISFRPVDGMGSIARVAASPKDRVSPCQNLSSPACRIRSAGTGGEAAAVSLDAPLNTPQPWSPKPWRPEGQVPTTASTTPVTRREVATAAGARRPLNLGAGVGVIHGGQNGQRADDAEGTWEPAGRDHPTLSAGSQRADSRTSESPSWCRF